MSGISIEIVEENKNITKKLISNLNTEKSRKRAYVSIISINSFIKHCQNENLKTNINESLSSCPLFLENYDIADMTVNDKKIDIRTIVGDEYPCLLIPRNHIFYGFTPDIYVAAKLNKEISSIEFIGFIGKTELSAFGGDKNYIIIDKANLHPMSEFKDTLEITKSLTFFSIPSEHEKAKSLFVSYLENTIIAKDKDYFIRHLAKCPKCKNDFNDFYKIETTLKKLKDKNLLNLLTLEAQEDEHVEKLNLVVAPIPVILPAPSLLPSVELNSEEKSNLIDQEPVKNTDLEECYPNEDFHNQFELFEYENIEIDTDSTHNETQSIHDDEQASLFRDEEIKFNENDATNQTQLENMLKDIIEDSSIEEHVNDMVADFNPESLNNHYQSEEIHTELTLNENQISDEEMELPYQSEEIHSELTLNENQITDEEMELPCLDQFSFDDEKNEDYLKIDSFDDCSFSKYDLKEINISDADLTEIENSFVGSLLSDFQDQYPDNFEQEHSSNSNTNTNADFSTLRELGDDIHESTTNILIEHNYVEEHELISTEIETVETVEEVNERNAVNDMLSSLDDIEIFETIDTFGSKVENNDNSIRTMFIPQSYEPESDSEEEQANLFRDKEIENLINMDMDKTQKEKLLAQSKKLTVTKIAIATTAASLLALSTLAGLYLRNNSMQHNISANTNFASISAQTVNTNNTNMTGTPINDILSNSGPNDASTDIQPQTPSLTDDIVSKDTDQIKKATTRTIIIRERNPNSIIEVNDVKWEIGQSLAANERLKSYLLLTSKMLRLSISKALIDVKRQEISSNIKLMTVFDLEGNLRYSAILQSSGSKYVDETTLKLIKENFAANKIPKITTKKEYIKINSIVLF